MRRLATIIVSVAALAVPAMAKSQVVALPPNVYFHFTDGHGNDFRVPQAVPTVTDCNPVKLAAVAKMLQKQVPLYAQWTYVKAECRARR
jgi:hypothetical protein